MIPARLRFSLRFYVLAALIAAAFCFGATCGRRSAPKPPSDVAKAKTVHVQAMARTDTVRAEVTRWLTRWRTDTIHVTDTFTVRDTLYRIVNAYAFDSTLRACQLLSDAVVGERSACATAKQALRDSLAKVKDRRWGCMAGVTGVVDRELRGAYGVGITCGRRVLP